MGDPPSGSLRLSAVADPSSHFQPSVFVLPQGEPAKDAPEFGFFQPRLAVAAVPLGDVPVLGLGGSVIPVGLSWDQVVPNAL